MYHKAVGFKWTRRLSICRFKHTVFYVCCPNVKLSDANSVLVSIYLKYMHVYILFLEYVLVQLANVSLSTIPKLVDSICDRLAESEGAIQTEQPVATNIPVATN